MLAAVNTRAIASNLFASITPPLLWGGRNRETGRLVFPLPTDSEYERVELPTRGRLWSFTVQRFAPKSPPYASDGPFTPFALGYVELPGALIIESRLAGVSFDGMYLGQNMRLTTLLIRTDADDCQVLTFAFRPEGECRT